jgi:hypothetical protein
LTRLKPEQLVEIGTIRVEVFRAERKQLETPYVYDASVPEVLDEIPERMLKGKAIKNNVK